MLRHNSVKVTPATFDARQAASTENPGNSFGARYCGYGDVDGNARFA
jgi:hypothetical protein